MKIIIDCSRKGEVNRIIEDYAYLSPVMYMQYFNLFYYTDRVLYNRMIMTNTHPLPNERICHLFAIANDDKYDFDTENGNHLYAGFLDAYDEYRTQLLIKKKEENWIKLSEQKKRAER